MNSIGRASGRILFLLCLVLVFPMGEGVFAQAYDPGYEPRADHNNPAYDPAYEAGSDPDHPLKGDEDPGPEWDINTRYDGTPPVGRAKGDWEWGELYYGMTYKAKITLKNECRSTETVTLTVNNLPYLSVPPQVRIPGRSVVEVEATITTPPEPNLSVLTGHESLPPMGIFVEISGETESLVVWHPWNPPCHPKRETFVVTGHIHFPPDSAPDPGAQRIAGAGDCQVYWNTGERPRRLKEDCTPDFRVLALHYRERVLQAYADRDPAAWTWLPSAGAIRAMDASALLAMKARADRQSAGQG